MSVKRAVVIPVEVETVEPVETMDVEFDSHESESSARSDDNADIEEDDVNDSGRESPNTRFIKLFQNGNAYTDKDTDEDTDEDDTDSSEEDDIFFPIYGGNDTDEDTDEDDADSSKQEDVCFPRGSTSRFPDSDDKDDTEKKDSISSGNSSNGYRKLPYDYPGFYRPIRFTEEDFIGIDVSLSDDEDCTKPLGRENASASAFDQDFIDLNKSDEKFADLVDMLSKPDTTNVADLIEEQRKPKSEVFRAWEAKINAALAEEERVEPFVCENYCARTWKRFGNGTRKKSLKFTDICGDRSQREVCRYFMASLTLASKELIDITPSDALVRPDEIMLTMLTRKDGKKNDDLFGHSRGEHD